MATISDFAAHFKGGVRPNLFRVDMEGPEFFNDFYFFTCIIIFFYYFCTAIISSPGKQKREKTSDCSPK